MSAASDNYIPQMIFRVLSDIEPPNKPEALYIFAQTDDNCESVFRAALQAVENNIADEIVILDSRQNSGYSGFDNWRNHLIKMGIPSRLISGAKLEPETMHNTLTEASAYIRYSKKRGHTHVYVCSSPFHQLRAFMTTVRAARSELPGLKIYNYPGVPQSWCQSVIHSQGILTAKRHELIETELLRIKKYHLKGDLISFQEAIKYLDNRDE